MMNDTFAPFHVPVAQLPRHCPNASHRIPRLGVAFIHSHLSHVSRRRSMKLPVVWEYQRVMCDSCHASLSRLSSRIFAARHCWTRLHFSRPLMCAAHCRRLLCVLKKPIQRGYHTHTHTRIAVLLLHSVVLDQHRTLSPFYCGAIEKTFPSNNSG
jgi:hypothetical protein